MGFANTGAIGAVAGAITITADTIALGANLTGAGAVTLQPRNNATSIGIGGAAGTFNLDTAELAFVVDRHSGITIGRATGTGAVTIDSATFTDPITIRSPGAGGNVTLAAGQTLAAAANAIVLTAGTGDAGLFTQGAGAIINNTSGAITINADAIALDATTANTVRGTGALVLTPTTNARPVVLGAAGAATDFALDVAELDVLKDGFSGITLGINAGTGAMTINSATFADPVTFRMNGVAGNITLAAGATLGATLANALTLTAGTGNSGSFTQGAGAIIQNVTGAITISADVMALDATTANSIRSAGAVTLQPTTAARPVVIGADGAATDFALSAAELATLQDGFSGITIGRSNATVGMTVNTATFNDPVTLQMGGAAGNLTLAAGPITVGGNLGNADDNLTLIATAGNLVGGAGTLTANNLTLTATVGGIGLGTAINTSTAGNLALATGGAAVAGNIALVEANALNTSRITTLATAATAQTLGIASGGDLTIGANIGNATDNLTLTSTGDLIYGGAFVATGATVSLNAGGADGDIGASGNAIQTTSATLAFAGTGTGEVYITETNGATVSGTAGSGVVSLTTTTGNWTTGNDITATGDVTLTAPAGDILRTAGTISANNLTLTAGGADGDIGVAATPILTSASTVTYTGAGTGEVAIRDGDGATMSGLTGSGAINLRTDTGNLVIGADLRTTGAISLTASAGDVSVPVDIGTVTVPASLTISGQNVSLANIGGGAAGVTGATSVTATTGAITFNGTVYSANAQTYTGVAGNTLVMNAGAATRFISSADIITFATGTVLLGDGSDLSAGTAGGAISAAAGMRGTSQETIDLNAGAAAITLGTVGSAAEIASVTLSGSALTLGIVTTTGDQSYTGDAVALGGNLTTTAGGSLLLQPLNNATAIGLGAGAGAFSLDATEIGRLQNGFSAITIGRETGTGAVNIAGALTFNDPLTVRSAGVAGSINLNASANIATGGNALVFTAGTGDSGLFTQSAGAVVNAGGGMLTIGADSIALSGAAASLRGTGTILLQPNTAARPIVLGAAGAATDFALTAGEVATLQDGFASVTIGRSDGRHAITVNALTFNDPVTIRAPGAGGQITLNGTVGATAGNDVTLVAGQAFVNAAGASAIGVSGGGRWLAYSKDPALNTLDDLEGDFTQYGISYPTLPSQSGNGLLYSMADPSVKPVDNHPSQAALIASLIRRAQTSYDAFGRYEDLYDTRNLFSVVYDPIQVILSEPSAERPPSDSVEPPVEKDRTSTEPAAPEKKTASSWHVLEEPGPAVALFAF